MPLAWSSDLETGIDKVDEQHRELLRRLIEFHRALTDGQGPQAVLQMMGFIERYAHDHFALEEFTMAAVRYPDYDEHKAAHDVLRSEVKKIMERLRVDGAMPSVILRTNFFLGGWWIEHISSMDKKMARFVRQSDAAHPKEAAASIS